MIELLIILSSNINNTHNLDKLRQMCPTYGYYVKREADSMGLVNFLKVLDTWEADNKTKVRLPAFNALKKCNHVMRGSR